MTNKDKKINKTAWLIYITICIFAALAVSLCSCQSQSGKLSTLPNEKVVILNVSTANMSLNQQTSPSKYKYKVRRIEKGVVDYIYDSKRFAQGDTIYHKFPN